MQKNREKYVTLADLAGGCNPSASRGIHWLVFKLENWKEKSLLPWSQLHASTFFHSFLSCSSLEELATRVAQRNMTSLITVLRSLRHYSKTLQTSITAAWACFKFLFLMFYNAACCGEFTHVCLRALHNIRSQWANFHTYWSGKLRSGPCALAQPVKNCILHEAAAILGTESHVCLSTIRRVGSGARLDMCQEVSIRSRMKSHYNIYRSHRLEDQALWMEEVLSQDVRPRWRTVLNLLHHELGTFIPVRDANDRIDVITSDAAQALRYRSGAELKVVGSRMSLVKIICRELCNNNGQSLEILHASPSHLPCCHCHGSDHCDKVSHRSICHCWKLEPLSRRPPWCCFDLAEKKMKANQNQLTKFQKKTLSHKLQLTSFTTSSIPEIQAHLELGNHSQTEPERPTSLVHGLNELLAFEQFDQLTTMILNLN